MSMIDENTWLETIAALKPPEGPTWLRVHAEVQQLGQDAAVWFLIDDLEFLEQGPAWIAGQIRDVVEQYGGTEFTVTFLQYIANQGVIWDSIEDEELRAQRISRPIGAQPMTYVLGDSELFPDAIDEL